MQEDIEKVRLDLALSVTNPKWVKEHWLNVAQPEQVKFTVDSAAAAYGQVAAALWNRRRLRRLFHLAVKLRSAVAKPR